MTNDRSDAQQDSNAESVRKSDGEWDQRTPSDAQASGSSDMSKSAAEIDTSNEHVDGADMAEQAEWYRKGWEAGQKDALDAKEREVAEARERAEQFKAAVQSNLKVMDRWLRHDQQLQERLATTQAKLEAVRKLHRRTWLNEDGDAMCNECGEDDRPVWPCGTIKALDGE